MKNYLQMLHDIMTTGVDKPTRAVLKSTGKNVHARSIFGYMMKFDLQEGFPLLTTKKLSFRNIKYELNWFLRGETNVKYLQENNVTIWDEWAKPDGELGPVYGKQWRDFGGVDQLRKLISDIRKTIINPYASEGRRLIISAWNPPEIAHMALAPCHILTQFNIVEDTLNCLMYQRSCDAFLGVPYNIASYALLTHIIGKITGLKPGIFTHVFGDLHIYENHFEQVIEQIARTTKALPTVEIKETFGENFELNDPKDIILHSYDPHPALKAEVAV